MSQFLLVSSRAQQDREDEYISWYTGTHVHEVLGVPGFVSGTFHRCVAPDGQPTGEFNAIYEVAEIEPSEILQALMSRRDQMTMTDAIDPTSVRFTFLSPP